MKKWLKIVGFALMATLIITLFVVFLPAKNLLVLGSFLGNRASVPLEIDKKIISQPINVAILGFTGAGNSGAYLTDTMIVAHIDPAKNKIILISVPRDLIVVEENKTAIKLNGIFWLNNERNPKIFTQPNFTSIKQQLENITNLPIHYATIFDVETVRAIVNGLGGLNVYISEKVSDPSLADSTGTGNYFNLEPGWRYLDGNMVVSLVRSRYAKDGDFFRIEHQQEVLTALGEKLKDLNLLTDASKLLKIKEGINGHFASDLNNNQLFTLATILAKVPKANWFFATLSFNEPNPLLYSSGVTTNTGYAYGLLPKTGVGNYTAIWDYISQLINA